MGGMGGVGGMGGMGGTGGMGGMGGMVWGTQPSSVQLWVRYMQHPRTMSKANKSRGLSRFNQFNPSILISHHSNSKSAHIRQNQSSEELRPSLSTPFQSPSLKIKIIIKFIK